MKFSGIANDYYFIAIDDDTVTVDIYHRACDRKFFDVVTFFNANSPNPIVKLIREGMGISGLTEILGFFNEYMDARHT
jgi:hypothetical protein